VNSACPQNIGEPWAVGNAPGGAEPLDRRAELHGIFSMNKSGQPTGTMPGWMTKLLSNRGQMVRADAKTIRRVDIMRPSNACLIKTLGFQAFFRAICLVLYRFADYTFQYVRINLSGTFLFWKSCHQPLMPVHQEGQ
jgi:hypothetical protein